MSQSCFINDKESHKVTNFLLKSQSVFCSLSSNYLIHFISHILLFPNYLQFPRSFLAVWPSVRNKNLQGETEALSLESKCMALREAT